MTPRISNPLHGIPQATDSAEYKGTISTKILLLGLSLSSLIPNASAAFLSSSSIRTDARVFRSPIESVSNPKKLGLQFAASDQSGNPIENNADETITSTSLQKRTLFDALSALRKSRVSFQKLAEAISMIERSHEDAFEGIEEVLHYDTGTEFDPVVFNGSPLAQMWQDLELMYRNIGQLEEEVQQVMLQIKDRPAEGEKLILLTGETSKISYASARELIDKCCAAKDPLSAQVSVIRQIIASILSDDATADTKEQFKRRFCGKTEEIAVSHAYSTLSEMELVLDALEKLSSKQTEFEKILGVGEQSIEKATEKLEDSSRIAYLGDE